MTCGLRNAFDAAFRLDGELFSFDSDMEGDENLPWYRPVRVNHCPPGADFVWRTGSANTPSYYIDSLPAIYDVGRGSPVGLEFYEHTAFPAKYQGAYLMADWSLGIIYAAHLKPDGATYKLDLEKFCTGAPMNVTDIGIAPDGSVYFTMGGRHTEGGVYRIVYDGPHDTKSDTTTDAGALLSWPQPQAAWSRAALEKWIKEKKVDLSKALFPAIGDAARPASECIKAMMLLQMQGRPLDVNSLMQLMLDRDPQVRTQAVYLIGVNNDRDAHLALAAALKDDDPLVRRRACEALIRCNLAAPLANLWPLLGGPRSVRPHRRPAVSATPVGQGLDKAPVDGGERSHLPGGRGRAVQDRPGRALRGADFRPSAQGRTGGSGGPAAIPAHGAIGVAAHARGQTAQQRARHRAGVRGAVPDEGLARQP